VTQIFQNLINNAVKFNNAGHKHVEIGWQRADNGQAELFVRDNGIGIDPRHHERIFRVFQRLHTSEEYQGTGVGLAIVKKASSKLHGSVRLESQVGEGSTFYVSFPEAKKENSR
jgi:light-regulated signal transduction histidine kinase (bacteriophytochrome)